MEKFDKEKANRLAKENNPKYIVENILNIVKERAAKGEFECKIRSYGFSDIKLYSLSPREYPENIKQILKELRELKFFADIRTDERQFVDVYLFVSWKD